MRLLGWLFWATLTPILFLQLLGIGAPLEQPGVPWGIVSLELAFTASRASEILGIWKSSGVSESALVSLGVDGAFLVAYPMLLFTSMRRLLIHAVPAPASLHPIGARLAWATLACIPLDACENLLLWRLVVRDVAQGVSGPTVLLAGIAASLKFLLIAAAIVWMGAALLHWYRTRSGA